MAAADAKNDAERFVLARGVDCAGIAAVGEFIAAEHELRAIGKAVIAERRFHGGLQLLAVTQQEIFRFLCAAARLDAGEHRVAHFELYGLICGGIAVCNDMQTEDICVFIVAGRLCRRIGAASERQKKRQHDDACRTARKRTLCCMNRIHLFHLALSMNTAQGFYTSPFYRGRGTISFLEEKKQKTLRGRFSFGEKALSRTSCSERKNGRFTYKPSVLYSTLVGKATAQEKSCSAIDFLLLLFF
ncbi:unknown [Clostridium sp. CAG:1024]|nr:unknown [Clostridium sp. CAG:1024]